MKRCNSCGRQVVNYTEIYCANCDEKIIRCNVCRENKNPYKCKCGFFGP